jgi:beta-glucuronidase
MKNRILLLAVLCLSFGKVGAQDFKVAETKDIALFPQQNEFRNKENLSGIWKFQKDSLEVGEVQNWQNGLPNTRSIAVPGSWNEQFTDSRDYLGTAWYEKEIFIPSSWKGQKIYVRIGSANYASKVYLNGKPVGTHEGGNLPFAFDISAHVNWNVANRITIQLENVLKPTRVPTGGGVAAGGMFNSYPKANFDFFPYAGLQRDVLLYSVQQDANIKDLTVVTGFENTTGSVNVKVETEGKATKGKVTISGNNKVYESDFVLNGNTANVLVKIPEVRLWSTEDPFLYKVSVSISDANRVIDTYELESGVRTISTNDKQILLNGKPVFLKGFGKHEDFPIFGRGTANPVIIKDYSLLKWVGANSYRTHYPYDEEYMNMADREGILIINEIPAVGLYFHGDKEELKLRQIACKKYIEELITRDKNHPAVIMWSVANEPTPEGMVLSPKDVKKADPQSTILFKELFDLVKKLDPTRLKTLVGVMGGPVEWLALSDVVCINRYWGWYTNQGDIKTGAKMLSDELDDLYSKLKKPIIVSEFGADTFPGMHADQAEMFTEEYQTQFIKAYLDVADTKDFVSGMHVWAFSDFKTGQSVIRFGGINYKGVFTRDRKPKMAAHYLRARWTKKPEVKN